MSTKPNLFIIGAPKCGTTSMSEYLKQHPDIFMCTPKEPNFFNTDLERKNRISKEEYNQLFKGTETYDYRGEATPLYLMSKVAARKIKEFSPDAKIIIMVRNPVDLIYSAYFQNLYNRVETIKDFEKALHEEENRRNGINLPQGLTEPKERLYYSEFVKFKEQIDRYLKEFGNENVHIIIYDDFRDKTGVILKELFEFLGITFLENIELKRHNSNKVVKNRYIFNLISNPPRSLSKLLRIIFPIQNIRTWIYRKLLMVNTSYIERKPLQPETRNLLEEKYKNEIIDLEKLLSISLKSWHETTN